MEEMPAGSISSMILTLLRLQRLEKLQALPVLRKKAAVKSPSSRERAMPPPGIRADKALCQFAVGSARHFSK